MKAEKNEKEEKNRKQGEVKRQKWTDMLKKCASFCFLRRKLPAQPSAWRLKEQHTKSSQGLEKALKPLFRHRNTYIHRVQNTL